MSRIREKITAQSRVADKCEELLKKLPREERSKASINSDGMDFFNCDHSQAITIMRFLALGPCQDISVAGRGGGIDGERSGLWSEMARVVREVQPRFVFVENSPVLTSRGLGRVLGDLAEMGRDARWCVLGASDAGAPHIRKRIWILAYPKLLNGQEPLSTGCGFGGDEYPSRGRVQSDASDSRLRGGVRSHPNANAINEERRDDCSAEERQEAGEGQVGLLGDGAFWREVEQPEPLVCRMGNGVANRVDRLASIGNGQVPAVVALAWRILSE